MKLSKTLPFAILSMAVVALAGCKNEFDGYKFYKLIEEVPATCTRGGMKAHYESEPNDKGDTIYLDVDKKKVDKEDLIIPATGHNMTFHKEVYSTCTEEGIVAHYHCNNCNLDYEDETGKVLIDDLHKSTKGHVMDHVWTPSDDGMHHYHKCAREGCDHVEDEELCLCDKEVVKEEFKVEGEENKYYKSCVCGRIGTETFMVRPKRVIDTDEEGYEAKVRAAAGLTEYDPSTDTQITLEDIGVSAADYIPVPEVHKAHIFGQYNIDDNNGIDLVFNFKYIKDTNDSKLVVYLGNQQNEHGLQIRLNTTRDDGYVEGYCYSTEGNLVKEDSTPFYGAGTEFYFLTKPGVTTDNEHKVEIKLIPYTPAQANANEDFYKIKVAVDGYVFRKVEGEPEIDNLIVGFPEGYFGDSTTPNHTFVRISSHNSTEADPHAYIKNATFAPRFILMDEFGGCIGSKLFSSTNNTISLPDLSSDGRKFMGYYDTKGARFTNSTEVDTKIIVYPHFIDDVENPLTDKALTLSDLGLLSQGFETSTTNNEIAGDFEEGFRRIPVGGKTTSVSISFVAQFKFAEARGEKVVDDYFQFGLPYDYKDNQTRFVFRINANSGASTLRGYVGGPATSLGEHGTEGTYFSDDKFIITEGASYLITMKYEASKLGAGLDYTIEVTNLATNTCRAFTYQGVKFINSDDFSFSNPYRNYFSVIRSRADAVLTMSNAW